jgi:hypothetical protein
MYVRRRFAESILLINATHSMSQLVYTVNQILVVHKTLSCQGLVSEDSQDHAALSSFLDPPLRTWGAASRVSMFQTPAQNSSWDPGHISTLQIPFFHMPQWWLCYQQLKRCA